MHIFQDHERNDLVKKIFLVFTLFYLIQVVLGSIIIYQVSISQTTDYLYQIANRVKEDIIYTDGKWDTRRYNADPELPGTYPLYVLSADGFVLDRWKPVSGFLDTSDVKRLLSYATAQTITTPTNQTWRMLSQPIMHNTEVLGVITVAYFNPSTNTTQVDTQLKDSIALIQSKITTNGGVIDTKNVDPRDISFDIAFQVVDKFNRIVTKSNNTNSIDRIPNFIDTSYIGNLANDSPTRQITDAVTNERFLLIVKPLLDSNNYITGIIVVGKSMQYMYSLLYGYLFFEAILGFALIVVLGIITLQIINKYTKKAVSLPSVTPEISVNTITFLKSESNLVINETKIHIPYATNQYYLCEAVFAAPRKHWEVDELLEKFGEEVSRENWRKVYDAMVIINKKVTSVIPMKLIVNKDKTYQLNPLLVEKLH